MSGDTDLRRIERMIALDGQLTRRFIEAKLNQLKESLMTDLSKLSASVDALTAQAAVNTKAIADLVALAQAAGADQSAIDAIQAKVDAATSQLATDDAKDPDAAPPAPAPAPAADSGDTGSGTPSGT
jgi:DNA-binding SARP family transcriptional activator